MTSEEKKEIIKNHPAFKGLEIHALDFITERVKERTYLPHEIIINQGDVANAVYFIYKGLIKIYFINEEGKQIPVKTSGEKYFIGDLGVVDGGPVPATVEAIQETSVLILTSEDFRLIMNKYPTFSINILEFWAKKTRDVNKQRENTFSLHLKDQVLIALKTLAPYFSNNEISLSQEELASIVGATRARVNEVLHELEDKRILSLSHTTIKIL